MNMNQTNDFETFKPKFLDEPKSWNLHVASIFDADHKRVGRLVVRAWKYPDNHTTKRFKAEVGMGLYDLPLEIDVNQTETGFGINKEGATTPTISKILKKHRLTTTDYPGTMVNFVFSYNKKRYRVIWAI